MPWKSNKAAYYWKISCDAMAGSLLYGSLYDTREGKWAFKKKFLHTLMKLLHSAAEDYPSYLL